MERSDALKKVLAYFHENHPDIEIDEATDLENSVFEDSITLVEVITFLEDDFGLSLERKDLGAFETAGGIADLVIRKQA